MISFGQLLIASIVQMVIGLSLGWFAHKFLRKSDQSVASAQPPTEVPTHPPVRRPTNPAVSDSHVEHRTLLRDIAKLVNQHAQRVESFQHSIEQPETRMPRDGNTSLSSEVDELREANRRFDDGVEQKVVQFSKAAEPAFGTVTEAVCEHRDEISSLDGLLGQVGPDASAEQLNGILSEALADVLESKRKLEAELSEAHEKLEEKTSRLAAAEHDARIDTLTRLPNRRAYEEQVALVHSIFERQHQMYALLMFDVDHFKSFNDTHGHAAGDALLQTVARVFLEKKRASDRSFRLGGEEFVMLLPMASSVEAYVVAERMRKAIEEMRLIFEGQELYVTTSVGVADSEEGVTPEQLLERADMALYAAKEGGRNRTHVHTIETSSAPAVDAIAAQTSTEENPAPVGA
jgi:diguanylate cyclase (GGDEF)-like protein